VNLFVRNSLNLLDIIRLRSLVKEGDVGTVGVDARQEVATFDGLD
jgi:hypothetical protein